jgi:hypothetical protein
VDLEVDLLELAVALVEMAEMEPMAAALVVLADILAMEERVAQLPLVEARVLLVLAVLAAAVVLQDLVQEMLAVAV